MLYIAVSLNASLTRIAHKHAQVHKRRMDFSFLRTIPNWVWSTLIIMAINLWIKPWASSIYFKNTFGNPLQMIPGRLFALEVLRNSFKGLSTRDFFVCPFPYTDFSTISVPDCDTRYPLYHVNKGLYKYSHLSLEDISNANPSFSTEDNVVTLSEIKIREVHHTSPVITTPSGHIVLLGHGMPHDYFEENYGRVLMLLDKIIVKNGNNTYVTGIHLCNTEKNVDLNLCYLVIVVPNSSK